MQSLDHFCRHGPHANSSGNLLIKNRRNFFSTVIILPFTISLFSCGWHKMVFCLRSQQNKSGRWTKWHAVGAVRRICSPLLHANYGYHSNPKWENYYCFALRSGTVQSVDRQGIYCLIHCVQDLKLKLQGAIKRAVKTTSPSESSSEGSDFCK